MVSSGYGLRRALELLLAFAIFAGSSEASGAVIRIPSVYSPPGATVAVRVFFDVGDSNASTLHQFIDFAAGIDVLVCHHGEGRGERDGKTRVSSYFPYDFASSTLTETCWVRVPSTKGAYDVRVASAVIRLDNPPYPEEPLPDSALGAGTIFVVRDLPTPTATPLPSEEPPVCGDQILQQDEQCDDGNADARDGCSSNCTIERRRSLRFGSGTCAGGARDGSPCTIDGQCPGGQCSGRPSGAAFQALNLGVRLPLKGELNLTLGSPRDTDTFDASGKVTIPAGDVPFSASILDSVFEPVVVPGLACACVRFGNIFLADRVALRGTIHCGDDGGSRVSYELLADHDTSDVDPLCESGTLEDDRCVVVPSGPNFTEPGPAGSATATLQLSTSIIVDGGTCCTVGVDSGCMPNVLKGGDGIPCTIDDLNMQFPVPVTLTTGAARAEILDADRRGRIADGSLTPCRDRSACPSPDEQCFDTTSDFVCREGSVECHCRTECNTRPCIASVRGAPFDCDALRADDENQFASGAFALAQVALNGPLGDAITTAVFAPVAVPTATAATPTRTPTRENTIPSTWTPTFTPTPTETGPPRTPTMTLTPLPPCVGSCRGRADGFVDYDDIRKINEISFGRMPIEFCPNADPSGDGTVTVDEIIRAAAFLRGARCRNETELPPTPTVILDCTNDCEGEAGNGAVRSWMYSLKDSFEAGDGSNPGCLRIDRDGQPGIGLLDAMAAIRDAVDGCPVVSPHDCADVRYTPLMRGSYSPDLHCPSEPAVMSSGVQAD